MTLAIPTVHMNGSSKEMMIRDLTKARYAIQKAVGAMAEVTPNGRDYYPQGPDAITEAIRQHGQRIAALIRVHDELGEIAMAISEGGRHAIR